MRISSRVGRASAYAMVMLAAAGLAARADEIIKFGISAPLSGASAVWGKGDQWMCQRAADEIKASGGIKVKGKVYQIECISYDNKYTAADGTKVAQTLINRDGVKFLYVLGTAPVLAAQALSERAGVMLFNTSWGMNSKGPKFPLTFQVNNNPNEMLPAMVKFITATFPQAKTIAFLNANDATGHEAQGISAPMWEKAGLKILASDYYERGTTEFQSIAQRLAATKADIINLSTAPAADAGQVFKELTLLGYPGIKVCDNGTSAEALMATGGKAVDGVYMGAAMAFDGPNASDRQRALNEAFKAAIGESLSQPTISAYDAVVMARAGIEKAQSIDPVEIAKVMPDVTYNSFYGDNVTFGGASIYGSKMAPNLPAYITQLVDGNLVLKGKVAINNP